MVNNKKDVKYDARKTKKQRETSQIQKINKL